VSPFHIKCQSGEVGKYVLLPGDPGRASLIAQRFLKGARVVNTHRGLLAYTGIYKDIEVSVVTTGMGTPSACIVTEEVIGLGAKVLIRVGTCGTCSPDVGLGSLIIPTGAVALTGIVKRYGLETFACVPAYPVLHALVEAGRKLGVDTYTGVICTNDAFYQEWEISPKWREAGVLAFEMECAGIFMISQLRKVQAGAILSVVGSAVEKGQIAEPSLTESSIQKEIEVSLYAIEILSGK
jgi:purine-nucleoside phosphorylase